MVPSPLSPIKPAQSELHTAARDERYIPTALALRPAEVEIAPADLSLCRSFIRVHSKSFYFSSLLLPRRFRHEAWALYAFCRNADDSVDGTNTGDGQVPSDAPTETSALLIQIDALRQRLQRIYAGRLGHGPAHAIDRAFAAVTQRTSLPRAVPLRLLAGMEMDAQGTFYSSWEELYAYCFSVASTVGLMMTYVLGHRMPLTRRTEVLLRACDLGIAMQLTNIARDVGEDGCRGRVYLPDEVLYRHGLSRDAVLSITSQRRPGAPLRPAPLPLRRAVAEILERANAHYQAARAGIPMLPPAAWLSIGSAERIYRGIGEKLATAGYDPLLGRAHVGTAGKLWRLLLASLTRLRLSYSRLPSRPTRGPDDELLLRFLREVEAI